MVSQFHREKAEDHMGPKLSLRRPGFLRRECKCPGGSVENTRQPLPCRLVPELRKRPCLESARTTMRRFSSLRTSSSTTNSSASRDKTTNIGRKPMKFQADPANGRRAEKLIRRTHDKLNHIHDLVEKFDDTSFTRKVYNLWSDDYERDMLLLRYRAPEYVAAVLRYDLEVGLDAKILDLACGTGLVGQELKRLQYVDVHGVDISPHMILRAQRKECYKSCRVIHDLKSIADCFDVVILCSAFGKGQIFLDSVEILASFVGSKAHMVIAQLSPAGSLENKQLQEFVATLASRLGARSPRVEPIERYVSGRFGLAGIVST